MSGAAGWLRDGCCKKSKGRGRLPGCPGTAAASANPPVPRKPTAGGSHPPRPCLALTSTWTCQLLVFRYKDEYNAVYRAHTPALDALEAAGPRRWRLLRAHGTAVGLPSDADMVGGCCVVQGISQGRWIGTQVVMR